MILRQSSRRVSPYLLMQKRYKTYSERVVAWSPAPPPKEYLADGVTPKNYPLYQNTYDHGMNWERWTYQPAGMFHTVYAREAAREIPWFKAWVRASPVWFMFPFLFTTIWTFSFFLINARFIGVKPRRYTPEWIAAAKERERAENTNPVTRYLDRRRSERGVHFLLGNIMPYHQYFIWMRNSHDYEAAEKLLARKARDAERDSEED